MAIARTETMRASNLSDYVNAKLNMGARSYSVLSDPACCPKCAKIYKYGTVWFYIEDMEYFPPLHTNCRCTTAYSTKTAKDKNGVSSVSGIEEGNKKLNIIRGTPSAENNYTYKESLLKPDGKA